MAWLTYGVHRGLSGGIMEAWLKKLYNVCAVISAMLIAIMIVVVVANVANRYLFNRAFFWSAEFSRYCTIWAVMIGATALVFSDKHLAINILYDHLIGRVRVLFQVFNRLLICIFLCIFIYSGWKFYCMAGNQICSTMRCFQMNLFYLIMPVSGVVMLVGCVLRIIHDIVKFRCGE